jgi:hypothetical protein
MSNLNAYLMQNSGMLVANHLGQATGGGALGGGGGDMVSLPDLMVESADLTNATGGGGGGADKMDDLSGNFSASLRLANALGGAHATDGGEDRKPTDAALAHQLHTPDVSAGMSVDGVAKNNLNRL